jgi:serine/threonine protein kinase
MEWIPGKYLDHIIEKAGTFTEQEAMTVMRDVGQALLALHRCDIVHRDIKPSNIFITDIFLCILTP